MIDTNTDKTKSNALFFTNQNSYADNINKIRYKQNDGINNSMYKNLRPLNKMNILPNKPEVKKLNSEMNFKAIGMVLLLIFFLALSAFLILFTTDKKKNNQTYYITAFYLNDKEPFVNEEFNETYNIKYEIKNKSMKLLEFETNFVQVEIKINSSLINLSNMFNGIENLIYINLSNINSFFIKDLSHTFENCINLEVINLTSFNSYNIKSMNSLFKGCSDLKNIIGLETIDTSSLDDIEEMFVNCINLTFVNLTSFNLDKIQKKNNTFDNNTSLKYVFLSNSNNLNKTIYTIFNYISFQDNNKSLLIQDNEHSIINSEWFDIIKKEEDITCVIGENEKCLECNNYNNKINMDCKSCNQGYYLPPVNIFSKTKCRKKKDNNTENSGELKITDSTNFEQTTNLIDNSDEIKKLI